MKLGTYIKPEELEVEELHTNKEDFYDEDARILLLEDDELTAEEIGFMEGYEEKE